MLKNSFAIVGILWLSGVFFLIVLNSCGNCTGPDINGEYACTEEDNTEPDNGGEGTWTWEGDEEDDGDEGSTFLSFLFSGDDGEQSCTPMPGQYPCYSKDNTRVLIQTKLDHPQNVTLSEVKYFSGNYESGNEIHSGDMARPGRISGTALYVHGKDTIMAVDGVNLRVSAVHFCETTCYEAEPVSLDLSLRPGVFK